MDPVLNPHPMGAGEGGLRNPWHIPPCRKGRARAHPWGWLEKFLQILRYPRRIPPLRQPRVARTNPPTVGSAWELSPPLLWLSHPSPAPVSPLEVTGLATGWKATKGKESPSKYTKVKAPALESFGKKETEKGHQGDDTSSVLQLETWSWELRSPQ